MAAALYFVVSKLGRNPESGTELGERVHRSGTFRGEAMGIPPPNAHAVDWSGYRDGIAGSKGRFLRWRKSPNRGGVQSCSERLAVANRRRASGSGSLRTKR